jgi:hypothetical protein
MLHQRVCYHVRKTLSRIPRILTSYCNTMTGVIILMIIKLASEGQVKEVCQQDSSARCCKSTAACSRPFCNLLYETIISCISVLLASFPFNSVHTKHASPSCHMRLVSYCSNMPNLLDFFYTNHDLGPGPTHHTAWTTDNIHLHNKLVTFCRLSTYMPR